MNISPFFTIALLLAFTSLAGAQPVVLTENNIGFTQLTRIDKENGRLEETRRTNLKAGFPGESDRTINEYGPMVIHDNLINNLKLNPQVVKLPKPKKQIVKPLFSIQNNLLFYWDYDDIYKRTVNFYDLTQRKIVDSHTVTSSPPNSLNGFKISRDGSTMAMQIGDLLTIFNYKEGQFIKTAEIGPRPAFSPLLVSPSGSRIFYNVKLFANDDNLSFAYVERTEQGWSDEEFLITPTLNVEGNDMPLRLVDIANDGKTIVTKTAVWPLQQQYVTVINEEDGKWTDSEYVGDYTLPLTDELVYHAEVYNSEDGRVIALLQPRRVFDYGFTSGIESYDLFVYIKDAAGKWSKHQVNPPGVELDGRSTELLSPNGDEVYWVPLTEMSVPFSESLK